MLRHHRLISAALLALVVVGCQSTSGGRRELGTLLTPGGEGYSGGAGVARPVAPVPTVSGAVSGGTADSEIGRDLDPADRQAMAQAEYVALETVAAGAEYRWRSDHSAVEGVVVAGEPYQVNRSHCRDYAHAVVTNGVAREWRGTACRQPSGSWRAVNS